MLPEQPMHFLLLLIAIQVSSGSSGELLARAEARLRGGSAPEAVELLTPFLEGPGHESAHGFLLRGTAYQTMGEPRRAALDLELAAALDSESLEARVRLGQVRLNVGRAVEAEQDFEKAVTLAPENSGAPQPCLHGPIRRASLLRRPGPSSHPQPH